jgi:1-deoxyxylulose-5-phosphate synthase
VEYVNLGRSGLKVSRICLGTMTYGTSKWRPWTLDEEESRPFIRRALELGINFFDTADVYSLGVSEEVVGRALRDFAHRDEVVIATKVHGAMGERPNQRGLSRVHIMNAVDASLRRLGTDYIDLYQIHRFDSSVPFEEIVDALQDVVKSGKVRYLGASSMYAWQFMKLLCVMDRRGGPRFISMQNYYNLAYREEEREMVPLCRAEGVGLIPWSPLARGLLAAGRKRTEEASTTRAQSDDFARALYTRENDFAVADRVQELAQRRGQPAASIALAWLLSQPGVVAPIVGASKLPQLDDAMVALDTQLSGEECKLLEEVYEPHPVLGHS